MGGAESAFDRRLPALRRRAMVAALALNAMLEEERRRMRPVDHFLKFFRQLPGLSPKALTAEDWSSLLAIEDRDEFRARVGEHFPALTDPQKDRMAQFLYDKHQELLREAGGEETVPDGGAS